MSSECSEPWPTKTKLRVADEILTFLEGAAFENEQIDVAMAAMGIAGNLKKEENNICASRSWSSDMSGTPCWEFKVHGETLGQQADLEHVIRQKEGNTNCRGFGMRCECWAISGLRQSTPT